MDIRWLHDVADVSLNLGQVRRSTYHSDGRTAETDTTHTVMLALSALELAHRIDLRLDVGLLVQLALVHDLVESVCGDTNTQGGLTAAAAAAKAEREHRALCVLRDRLGSESPIIRLIEEYERQVCVEARVIRYLDKVMPKLTHHGNGCVAPRLKGLDRQALVDEHARQDVALAEQYPDLASIIGPIFRAAAENCEQHMPIRQVRTCNKHDNCDLADEFMMREHSRRAVHCHDDCCEECFGS